MRILSRINFICVLGMVGAVLILILALCGESLGIRPAANVMGYETRLFDYAKVHTLDIVMDGWEDFLSVCENEEYVPCSVVIDGETWENVGLRAKGNTSLTSVRSMNSQRYSMKIEFDRYEKGETYYGLDKLCLNNSIQDNTYMKDYLTYRMMNEFEADAPLCAYVDVTVNQEKFGLFLAVEAVEDGFLRRNYGLNGGTLYKPDSMGSEPPAPPGDMPPMFGNAQQNGEPPMPPMFGDVQPNGMQPIPGNTQQNGGPPMPPMFGNVQPSGMPPMFGDAQQNGMPPMPKGFQPGDGGNGPPGFGASEDVRLVYTDENPDSYANIFKNAKVPVSSSDRVRLIRSLKTLNERENIETAIDTEKTLRYFVVHNYTVNGDSYTGGIVHNYYLHEKNGVLSMIPWDYNLAFGGFQSWNASSAVNDPIDSPLSVSGEERPMADWIFAIPKYQERYREYFKRFLEQVDILNIINETETLIASYVADDPTRFCTFEEFQKGVDALRSFCELRTESVRGQLEGNIPATDEEQRTNPAALVDASSLNLSDMGGGPGAMPGGGPFGMSGMSGNPFMGQAGGNPSATTEPENGVSESSSQSVAYPSPPVEDV